MSLLHQLDLRGVGQNDFGAALIIDEFPSDHDLLVRQLRQRKEFGSKIFRLRNNAVSALL